MPLRRREMFDGFEPYTWEPSTEEIARDVGLPPQRIVRLDLNTSPIKPNEALRRLSRMLPNLRVNEYPDTSYRALREALAEYTEHDPEAIIPTNGADEAIDILSRVFLEKGMKALASVPTYSYFRIATELQGAEFVRVRRKQDLEDDVDAILSSLDPRVGIVFFCSPNNPTGNLTPPSVIEKVSSETDACIVVDEAYYEYCGQTAEPLTEKYENVVVVRTLSKAFGLAGARIGYILSSRETTRLINRARPPNSLGVMNIELAKIALRYRAYVKRVVRLVSNERERVAAELKRIGVTTFASAANFLLMRFEDVDAGRVYEGLLRRGIVVRRLSGDRHVENCLRVTIGLKRHNDLFLSALTEVLEGLRRQS